MAADTGVLGFTMKTIDGKEQSLAEYQGKVLLIVNVASKCGFTPQYTGLEALYRKYKDKGLLVLGFPANNFAWQEPGSDAEIQKFCSTQYDVTFPMYSKISVKGKDIDPLYKFLTEASGHPGDVSWNFNKFLVDRHGKVVGRWGSRTAPDDKELTSKIEEALAG